MAAYNLGTLSWVTLAMILVAFVTEAPVMVKRNTGKKGDPETATYIVSLVIAFFLAEFLFVGIVENLKPTAFGSAIALIIAALATIAAIMGISDLVKIKDTPKTNNDLQTALTSLQNLPSDAWSDLKAAPGQAWKDVKSAI